MLTKLPGRQGGVTLVELMVTVVIAGILMAVGIPQMGEWIRRNSVGSAAETVQNGLRQAEAEAIRRNQRVEFLLTNAAPSQSGILSLTAADNGKNWAVRVSGTTDAKLAYVSGFQMAEISSAVELAGPASLFFTGMGRVTDSAGAAVTDYQVYRLSRSGADRAVCVFVTPGGAIKSCDPALASGKPFACLPLVSLAKCPKV